MLMEKMFAAEMMEQMSVLIGDWEPKVASEARQDVVDENQVNVTHPQVKHSKGEVVAKKQTLGVATRIAKILKVVVVGEVALDWETQVHSQGKAKTAAAEKTPQTGMTTEVEGSG